MALNLYSHPPIHTHNYFFLIAYLSLRCFSFPCVYFASCLVGCVFDPTELFLETPENDKFLVILTLLQLRVLRGKSLFFVNDIDGCFK